MKNFINNQMIFLTIAGLIIVGGCQNVEKFPLAQVEGTVLCEGNPVAFATVYFVPAEEGKSAIIGKPGQAITKQDGTFRVSTYQPNDGAVIGKHTIRVGTSSSTDPACPAELSHSKVVQTVNVVKSGNQFTIDLPKRKPKQKLVIEE
ncbi:MAG: hypothetical protein LBT05_07510 [Planctomycetaceae bacterium]|jgi:hypothetical protein|nr:hypothetical protein [Planctomycetaceae bacterium]